ncbi:MAG TPA: SIMPL domain-containing protein [Solirubrobacterales bacterium]|jgi:hypothetical protein|nr:SIMPL domain-containing protein [Solirubrobacterales bacterium]
MPSLARRSTLLALLALALVVPATAGAAVERTVSVSASATLKVPNDSAGLGFSVSRERRSRGAALSAVASGLRGVIAAVQGISGVGSGDVETGRITVHKTFRGQRPVYRAAEGIGVTLHQPDRAGELVSAAIAAGATGVSGPNFFVGDPELAFGQALAAAFGKAKARAGVLAVQAGATLGPAIEIDEGSGGEFVAGGTEKAASVPGCVTASPTAPVSKRCTATPPPVKPGTSRVTATVHVVFGLQ